MNRISLLLFVLCILKIEAQAQEGTKEIKPRVLLPLTSSLNISEQKQIELQAKQSAFELYSALKNNDWKTLSKFIPSKETYAKMIENFGAPDGETSAKIVALNKIYPQEKKRIESSFIQIQKMLKKYPDFTATDFVMNLKQNVSVRGGRGALVLKNKSNEQHVVNYMKYYEWNGQWYVTNKLFWFK